MTGPLSPEAIEAYRRDGWVVVKGVFGRRGRAVVDRGVRQALGERVR